MTATWDATRISTLLCSLFRSTAGASPTATIDVLITFDRYGVSGPPNHTSLYYGAREFISALVRGHPGRVCPVDMYTLTTVPFLRKYKSFFDILPALVAGVLRTPMRDRAHPARLLFLCRPYGLGNAWRAMKDAHKSQMAWFRYGWVTLADIW